MPRANHARGVQSTWNNQTISNSPGTELYMEQVLAIKVYRTSAKISIPFSLHFWRGGN